MIQVLFVGALLVPPTYARYVLNLVNALLSLYINIDASEQVAVKGDKLAEEHSFYRLDIPQLRRIDNAARTNCTGHVGVGSNFGGVSGMVPDGMRDPSKYVALVQRLTDRGYSDRDVREIMGEDC